MKILVTFMQMWMCCISIAQGQTALKGDYLGQPLPGKMPELFAPGIVSSDDQEHGVPAFSPDGNEVFWLSNRPPGPDNENWLCFGKTMRRVGDVWSEPESSLYKSAIFSIDGQRLYFGSEKEGDDPYYVEKQNAGWSDGTLYFMGYAEGQWINLGIYRSELINGRYEKPELLPSNINTASGERNWAPYIAADESYLIFCSTRGLPESDQGDLFITFRNPDGRWTDPLNMGPTINTSQMERFSCVTPDGKYLFFTRDHTKGYEDVFWVKSDILNELKEKVMQ